MFRIIAIIVVGFGYYQIISGTNKVAVPVNADDAEVKAAIVYAFGPNSTQKEVELVDGEKLSISNQIVYKLKVRINYYNQCNDNETSIWVIHTDKGCKTTSFCNTEVTKLNTTDPPFSMDSLQCIA